MKVKSILITAFVVLAVMCLGTSASAKVDIQARIIELQAKITELLAQLKTLQAIQQSTPTTPATGTASWCHDFRANIGVGVKAGNPELEALKTALEKEGLFTPSASSTAKGYDQALISAVKAFQEKYLSEILSPSGLKRGTGFFGVATRAKLNKIYGCLVNEKPAEGCSNLWWFDNTSTATTGCQAAKQFCGLFMYFGLQTFPTHEACQTALNASTLVNGVCGTANSVASAAAPTTGLCTAGTASTVTEVGTSTWNWTCSGSNSGTNESCSAPVTQ